jgi:hypothetical protein
MLKWLLCGRFEVHSFRVLAEMTPGEWRERVKAASSLSPPLPFRPRVYAVRLKQCRRCGRLTEEALGRSDDEVRQEELGGIAAAVASEWIEGRVAPLPRPPIPAAPHVRTTEPVATPPAVLPPPPAPRPPIPDQPFRRRRPGDRG